jgi:hypothetical protein
MFLQSNPTVNVFSTQVTLSGLSVLLIQSLKNSSWATWFNRNSDKLNKAASGVLALLAAIGIHMSWTHGALPGTYMMEISGVTLYGIAAGVWAVTKSLVMNELLYRGTIKAAADVGVKVTSTGTATVQVAKPAADLKP